MKAGKFNPASLDHELAMRIFIVVAEELGFSVAARRLGLPQSTVSRQIIKLEERLGTKLLQRTTRRLSLTEHGQQFLERIRPAMAEIDIATAEAASAREAPEGVLRVTMPASFGRCCIMPLLPKFMSEFPNVSLGLSLSDEVKDIVHLGFDVSIRMGALPDSSLIARRLTTARSLLCASPEYLAKHGEPTTVDDLTGHNCLQFRVTPGKNTWSFFANGKDRQVKVNGTLFSDSGDALLEAAIGGVGIAFLPKWLVIEHMEDGQLVRVLPEALDNKPNEIFAVYPTRKLVPAKVSSFVSFLSEELA